MGPVNAKGYLGQAPVRVGLPPAGRAKQEIAEGRRGKGSIFGAFCPATGAAFTRPDPGRGTGNWVDFLEEVEGWLPQDVERIDAIVGNLSSHRATDVLLVHAGASALRDGVPAEIRRLPQPDRAVVEGAVLLRPSGTPLRDLGRGHRDRPRSTAPH
jgi:hypothetical protein